jgi:hypothetical protein
VDDDVDRVGIVPHALFDEARERREHQGAVDAELVHQLRAGGGLTDGGDRLHRGAEGLARLLLPSGLPFLKRSSIAPGRATTSKWGWGCTR